MTKKLKNPSHDIKPESKFLNEIYNGKETNMVNQQYLASMRRRSTAVRESDRHMTVQLVIFSIIVASLIIYAYYHQYQKQQEVATRELSIKLLN